MTMDFTVLELVLIVWAVVATAGYFHMRDEARSARHILRMFIEDKEARDKLVESFEKFKRDTA